MGHKKLMYTGRLSGLQLGTRRAGVQPQTGVRQLDNLKFLREKGSYYEDDACAIQTPEAGTSWDLSINCEPTA